MRQQRTPRPIEAATELAMEGMATNDAGRRLLYDPSPEIDSLAERLVELEQHGVPRRVVRALLADLREALSLNLRERAGYRALAGTLDRATRIGAAPELSRAGTVRGAINLLREPLELLAANEAGVRIDGRALVEAVSRVRRVVAVAPRRMLLSRSLRSNLGGRKHRVLVREIEKHDREKHDRKAAA